MDGLNMMHEDNIDVFPLVNLEGYQPNPAVQDKAMAGDAAPGEPPHLDFDGALDVGDKACIAKNIDDFLNDFLAIAGAEADAVFSGIEMVDSDLLRLADIDGPPSSSPGDEVVAAGVEQDVFSSEATSSTMSVVPEASVVAAAVGITTPATGRGDLLGLLDDDDPKVYAPTDVSVATSNSTGNDCALNMSSASAPPASTSRNVAVTALAAAAATDVSGFFHDVPSVGVPTAIVSATGGESVPSNKRAAAIKRYLAKRSRRCWTKASSYKSRQRVANSRPRHRGRFVPQESDFVPIAELKRRQWVEMKERLEKEAKVQ